MSLLDTPRNRAGLKEKEVTMTISKLIQALNRLKVETGSLACMGIVAMSTTAAPMDVPSSGKPWSS